MQLRNYKSSALAFSLALALAGCGGGSSSGPAPVATLPPPPPLPPPPSIPSGPTAAAFDGTYNGSFAGVDQLANVSITNADSSALQGFFTSDLTIGPNGSGGRVSTTGTIDLDGNVSTTGQGNSAFPGTITVDGQVQQLGTGQVLIGTAMGNSSQSSQNATAPIFTGRIYGIQDGNDNAYGGTYSGTLSGSGGNGNFNFTVQSNGSVRGDVTSLSTFNTTFEDFSPPKLVGVVTRDGVVRFTAVSGKAATPGDPAIGTSDTPARTLFIEFEGQGNLTSSPVTITGFYTVGDPQNALTGTFTARRN